MFVSIKTAEVQVSGSLGSQIDLKRRYKDKTFVPTSAEVHDNVFSLAAAVNILALKTM